MLASHKRNGSLLSPHRNPPRPPLQVNPGSFSFCQSRGRASAPEVHMQLFQNAGHSYKDLFPRRLEEVLDNLNYYQRHVLSNIAAQGDWGARQIAYNHIAKTVPSFMHFPGYKAGMQLWWGRMWWMQEEKSRISFTGTKGVQSTPFYKFIQYTTAHESEEEGYGIKLANGTWHSYFELCEPFFHGMLKNDPIFIGGTATNGTSA